MFLIYIDELAKLLKSHGIIAKLFADDVKVYVKVEIVNAVDAYKLQTALDLIAEWAATWQLQVSVNKCNILHIGSVQCSIDYFIDDVELQNNKRCRYLGVIVTSDLSPSMHINEITAKAHYRANCILRCLSVKTLACLYARFSCMFDQSLSIVLWHGRHVQNRILRLSKKSSDVLPRD